MLARPRRTLKQAVVLVAALAGFALYSGPAGARRFRDCTSPHAPAGGRAGVGHRFGISSLGRGIFLIGERRVASLKATGWERSSRFLIPHGVSGLVRIRARVLARRLP